MQFGEAEIRDSYAILPAPLRAYDKGEISYKLLEVDKRDKHRKAILSYLKRDVISLHALVSAFVANHGLRPLTAASAGMRHSKSLGIRIETLTDKKDEHYRQFYYGGLVLARRPGIHQGAFSVYDIKSAYPCAMAQLHCASKSFDFTNVPKRGVDGICAQGFYTVSGSNTCFLQRGDEGNTYGGKGTFRVTGWELREALRLRLFRGKIRCGEIPTDVADFKPYVTHHFDEKQRAEKEGDKAGRLIHKIMLNALYGKFAQRPDGFRDYVIMPVEEPICGDWEESAVYEEHGFSVWSRPAERGTIYNVATAASITGYVRALLMRAIHETNAYYCDTDSIITDSHRKPTGIHPDLGGWQLEMAGDLLAIAGKKLYAIRLSEHLSQSAARAKGYLFHQGRAWKVASKGCRLNPGDIIKLCQGKTIDYKNDAPSFSLLNSPFFLQRTIRATA